MTSQTDSPEWRGDVPISPRFDDPYYSLDNGLAETTHVFLTGNDLPARMTGDLHIAELGFGTGLNFLATVDMWRRSGTGRLRFTSFEAFPLPAEAARRALARFANLSPAPLCDRWDMWQAGPVPYDDGITLQVVPGDARTTLPAWTGLADAWFLDGFSPAKNPELWDPALMQAVYDHTTPGGTFATYTAAGHVRRALEAAGFALTRTPGYGRKRHMTQGHRPKDTP